MKIRFFGAAGEVTGSCYLIETERARLLVDFGMHQGGAKSERRNRRFPPFKAKELDCVVVTHAHLDHTGRLPLLSQHEYKAPIYATPATIDLTDILLRDSARIQMEDAERENRRRRRQGRGLVKPLYDERDVERVLAQMQGVRYGEAKEVAPGVTIRYFDAGHILGSASVEMTVREGGRTKVIAFSGDLGPKGVPLMRDPVPIEKADLMILESTYGDRDHRSVEETEREFVEVIRGAQRDGKVIIPSFAVGRTQRLIYAFDEARRKGQLNNLKVFVDSPMATEVTETYCNHRELFDEEYWALLAGEKSCLYFPGLKFTRDVRESIALNDRDDGIVVIASAGMCTGGRVLHHLRHGLWKENVDVVFVGYQAEGTLGRRLVNGEKRVRVMGEPVVVKAKIHTINGFSAHAGQSGLVEWAGAMERGRPKVILTHGENKQRAALSAKLKGAFGMDCAMPEWGDVIEV